MFVYICEHSTSPRPQKKWRPDFAKNHRPRRRMLLLWNWAQVGTLFPRDRAKRSIKEFNNAGCLLISEVKYLLENRDKDAPDTAYVSISHQRNEWSSLEFDRVYNKTLEYVKTFAKFNTTDSASAVREYAATSPVLLFKFMKFLTFSLIVLSAGFWEESLH